MVGSSKPAPNSPQEKQRMRPESHSGQNQTLPGAGRTGRPRQPGWYARRQGPPHTTRPACNAPSFSNLHRKEPQMTLIFSVAF